MSALKPNDPAVIAWIASRPPIVQELLRKYPIGSKFNIHGATMHAIAWGEDGGLTITPIDPEQNYSLAVKFKQRVCGCCMPKLQELLLSPENP